MEVDEQVRLVRSLADLAGRAVSVAEARRVVDRAVAMSREEANAVWSQHRVAPQTVAFHAYLAMTLRFVLQAKGPRQR